MGPQVVSWIPRNPPVQNAPVAHVAPLPSSQSGKFDGGLCQMPKLRLSGSLIRQDSRNYVGLRRMASVLQKHPVAGRAIGKPLEELVGPRGLEPRTSPLSAGVSGCHGVSPRSAGNGESRVYGRDSPFFRSGRSTAILPDSLRSPGLGWAGVSSATGMFVGTSCPVSSRCRTNFAAASRTVLPSCR